PVSTAASTLTSSAIPSLTAGYTTEAPKATCNASPDGSHPRCCNGTGPAPPTKEPAMPTSVWGSVTSCEHLPPPVATKELAAGKVLALFDRAEARDFLDLDALVHHFDF